MLYLCLRAFLVSVGTCPTSHQRPPCIECIHACIHLQLPSSSLQLWRRPCQKWARKQRNEWDLWKIQELSSVHAWFRTSYILVHGPKRSCYLSVILENLIMISVWEGKTLRWLWNRYLTPPAPGQRGCVVAVRTQWERRGWRRVGGCLEGLPLLLCAHSTPVVQFFLSIDLARCR